MSSNSDFWGRGIFRVWDRNSVEQLLYKNFFQFGDFLGWKRSVGKKSPGCAKNMLIKSIIEKRSENWVGKISLQILDQLDWFFLFVEKCTNETLCWRASQWIFCVWFFFVSKGSIKNWSHIIFVLNFHEQTAINFRTIIESWQWSWFFSCVLKKQGELFFEINDQKLY